MDPALLEILRCPITRSRLHLEGDRLISEIGGVQYPINDGIPQLLAQEAIFPPDAPTLAELKAKFHL